MSTSGLTHKERQLRGLDSLGRALRPLIDERMTIAAYGQPWIPLYEAKETSRLGRPYRADAADPRLLLRVLRYERTVFTEIDASQRAWIDELIQVSNKAAHSSEITAGYANRALDTMTLLAESIGLDEVITELIALQVSGDEIPLPPPPPVPLAAVTSPAPPPSAAPPASLVAGVTGGTELPRGVETLTLSLGTLEVAVFYRDAINFALVHNRVSPIIGIFARNNGTAALTRAQVTLTIESPTTVSTPVAQPLNIELPTLEPEELITLPSASFAWRFSSAPFVAIDEAVLTDIGLEVTAPAETAHITGDIRLLPADEWWARSMPEVLAAFVRPNSPAIGRLLSEASQLLEARTGSPSLEGYQSGPSRVHEIAEAIYAALAARRITYIQAPSSFEGTGQRIRTHREVLEERRGNCLDLACTYAAALEQAGIHSVIAVVEGHAFAGYLTDEVELPAVAITEKPAIVTIADSDLFDAVETTAVCAGDQALNFDQARGQARHWWHRNLNQVEYLLDVHAAHMHVKPLPTIQLTDGVRVVEVIKESIQVPLRRTPTVIEKTERPTVEIPGRVDRWQRALLDMTYRNPLLKLKKTSSTAIHVPLGSLERLEDKIADGQPFRLVAHDDIAAIHYAQGARTAADVQSDTLAHVLDKSNTLFVALTEREYTNRLRSIQRRARTSREETGASSLYLVIGTLEWTEGSREGRAPIYLAPIRIVGGRGGTPFSIELDESREVEPNYCLIEKLRTGWGLDIPELTDPGEDESGIDVAKGLAAIRTAILKSRNQTFKVEETAYLSLIQFSTLEMWRDLRDNWSTFMQRPAVSHLVTTPGQPFIDQVDPPEPDPTAEASAHLPIPADGSQIEAIRWAAAGKSFILEGPPGTGKSQTITNLIAHCLAGGKKVLFVAEKQAALDVVKKRLDSVGLGELSLDMHGKNQTVTAVRQQISDALELSGASSPAWEQKRARYKNLVAELAIYPELLHQPGPVDMSAWDARQVLVEQEITQVAVSAESLVVPRSVVMGSIDVAEVYSTASELGFAVMNMGQTPRTSPWRLAGPLDPAHLDRPAITAALEQLAATEQQVHHPLVMPVVAFADSPEEFTAIAQWLDALAVGVARPSAEVAVIVTPQWRQQAQSLLESVENFYQSRRGDLEGFTPGVLDEDLDSLVGQAEIADKKLFGKKKRRLAVLAALQRVVPSPEALPLKELTGRLRTIASLRNATREFAQSAAQLPGTGVPHNWNPFDDRQRMHFHSIVDGLRASADVRRAFANHVYPDVAQGAVDQMTVGLISDGSADAVTGDAIREVQSSWLNFLQVLGTTEHDYRRWLGRRVRGEAVENDFHEWRADAAGSAYLKLQRWVTVRFLLEKLQGMGLDSLTDEVLDGRLAGGQIEESVRHGVARAVLDERLDSTGLTGFDSEVRAHLVGNFISYGDELRQAMAAELGSKIIRARTFDPTVRVGLVADLRQQLGRRRGGLTVRQLHGKFGSLITQITPCFLMSPASVSRFLPADGVDFDVVVFDEASQIRVPEAIGAMGRGKSVVIVGDSKQMPPSAMFASGGVDEDDEEEVEAEGLPVPADLESILSEGVESRLPQLLLTWHYRSRDEALIAFSNSQYYEGRLSSFPSPPEGADSAALTLRHVSGQWEGGGRTAARINRAEAAAVIEEIRRRLAVAPDKTIGVVTFNTKQRDHILDLLEEARQADPRVEEALTRDDEPLFVKNLENVQGDERDAILFTLAFAANERGRVPLNWGPLSRAGGERRLNVAITRAKEQVVVFCSFEPHELDLSNSSSRGLADLKDYLLGARNGMKVSHLRRAEARDLHLEDVARGLSAAGLEVRTHIGLSDFTIDLAVRVSPEKPWVAILLDGPAWASRTSVGDREGLPTVVLTEQMGWARVERIWLPSWVAHREDVIAKIVEAAQGEQARQARQEFAGGVEVERALEAFALEPVSESVESQVRSETPVNDEPVSHVALRESKFTDVVDVPVSVSAGESGTGGARPFVAASTDPKHPQWMLDYQQTNTRGQVLAELIDVIKTEGPILDGRLAKIVAARFDLNRVRETRRHQILAVAPSARARKAPNGDVIYWAEGQVPDEYDVYRVGTLHNKRDIDDIPYHELRNAMVHAIHNAHSMTIDDTLRETARIFGITRLGANVRERLEGVMECAVKEGLLTRHESYVSAG